MVCSDDMAGNTASSLYLLRKAVEGWAYALFPAIFHPLYSMVAFSTVPYHEAVQRAERQDKWIGRLLGLGLLALGGSLAWKQQDVLRRMLSRFH